MHITYYYYSIFSNLQEDLAILRIQSRTEMRQKNRLDYS